MPGRQYNRRTRSAGEKVKSFPGAQLYVDKMLESNSWTDHQSTMQGLKSTSIPDLKWTYIGNKCLIQTDAGFGIFLMSTDTTGFYTSIDPGVD